MCNRFINAVKNALFILPLASAMLFQACTNKNEGQIVYPTIQEEIQYDLSGRINAPVYFCSPISTYIQGAFQKRFTNIVNSVGDADVIVIASNQIGAHTDEIFSAWSEGKIIVEVEPTVSDHCNFWNSHGITPYISQDETRAPLILAVWGLSTYSIAYPFDGSSYVVMDEDDFEESNSGQEAGENVTELEYDIETVSVQCEKTDVYVNTLLASFVNWVNEAADAKKKLSEEVPSNGEIKLAEMINDLAHAQHNVKAVPIGTERFEFARVSKGSDPDWVSRSSQIDVSWKVYPMYSYSCKGDAAGDYYLVSLDLNSHNGPLYSRYSVHHGAVLTLAHIFFSTCIEWKATLLDSKGNIIATGLDFFQDPSPTTTASGMTYSDGFSRGFSIGGNGGVSGGSPYVVANLNANFSWSKNTSVTIQDQSIELETGTADKSVTYRYKTNNIHHDGDTEDAFPAIGRTDQHCIGKWVWHVKTSDYSDDTYKLRLELNPEYGHMHTHVRTWAPCWDGRHRFLIKDQDRVIEIPLIKPDRTPCGTINFKNTTKNFVNNVRYQSLNPKMKSDFKTVNCQTFATNESVDFSTPEGKVNIIYDLRDGDEPGISGLIGTYIIENVNVKMAEMSYTSTLEARPYKSNE